MKSQHPRRSTTVALGLDRILGPASIDRGQAVNRSQHSNNKFDCRPLNAKPSYPWLNPVSVFTGLQAKTGQRSTCVRDLGRGFDWRRSKASNSGGRNVCSIRRAMMMAHVKRLADLRQCSPADARLGGRIWLPLGSCESPRDARRPNGRDADSHSLLSPTTAHQTRPSDNNRHLI